MLPGLPEGNYTVTATFGGFYSNSVMNVPVIRGMGTLNVNITLDPKPYRLYGVVKAARCCCRCQCIDTRDRLLQYLEL